MISLKLNENWDIFTDASGNIALTDEAYQIAQTAANKIRLFTKDAYFNQTSGIPHFDIELGKPFSASETVITNRIRQAALSVEGVTDCRVQLELESGRYIGGKVYVTTTAGTVSIEI